MIFVLGGEGFLGSAIVAELRKQGRRCVAITRRNYKRHKGRSCDVLINANGNSVKFLAERDPALDFDLAVRSTLVSILDFKYKRYVYVSSVAIYPDPSRPRTTREDMNLQPPLPSRYGFHRLLSELIVRQYASDWLILRLGGLVGIDMKKGPLFDLQRGGRLHVNPKSKFQFLDVRDAAIAALKLAFASKRNAVYNVAGRGALTMRDVARRHGLRHSAPARAPRENWNVSLAKAGQLTRLPKTAWTVARLMDGAKGTRA